LGEVYNDISAQNQYKRLKSNWDKYKNSKRMAIFKALAATYKGEFFIAFFINFIVVSLQISIPFIITYLIDFMSSPSGEDGGIWLGIGLVSAYIIAS